MRWCATGALLVAGEGPRKSPTPLGSSAMAISGCIRVPRVLFVVWLGLQPCSRVLQADGQAERGTLLQPRLIFRNANFHLLVKFAARVSLVPAAPQGAYRVQSLWLLSLPTIDGTVSHRGQGRGNWLPKAVVRTKQGRAWCQELVSGSSSKSMPCPVCFGAPAGCCLWLSRQPPLRETLWEE